MASSKEIRNKINSIKSTQKITRAMEMVATSKMRRAQDRMCAARPYAEKIRNVVAHLSDAFVDYAHPYLRKPVEMVTKVGLILITSDKSLCGALNSNALRLTIGHIKTWQDNGATVSVTAIGGHGLAFVLRNGAKVISRCTGLGDTARLEKLIGPIKVMLDAYKAGDVQEVHILTTRFINTMKQEPILERLLPLPEDKLGTRPQGYTWQYLFEPDTKSVIDELMMRYVEALVYQAVSESMASEQAARMVAMKAATDNAQKVIHDLQLLYNKTRQAAITKELTEIIAGASAV